MTTLIRRSAILLALLLCLFVALPSRTAQASGEFAWQSLSFDGGVDPILGGSIAGTIDGVPVPSPEIGQLENTGIDFHLRWSSQLAAHLGLRFSVGYTSFSPNMGFHGLSALPLTVGLTFPLYDPRNSNVPVIPYLATDFGPSFNSLPANGGNVGSVSFTADAGVGLLYPLSPTFSLYGEVLPTMLTGPIASNSPQTNTNVSSSVMWTIPVLLGITYNFRLPHSS
jgi:hypothetical protein